MNNAISLRGRIGIFLLRLSRGIRASIPLMLTPRDLTEANRRFFNSPSQINAWGKLEWIQKGLDEVERKFLDKYQIKSGKILVLGCGGGREAIGLAKLGFEVTGIDFVDKLLEMAKRNAAFEKAGVSFEKQDMAGLNLKENFFDQALLVSAMYSFILVSNTRIEILKRVKKALRPGGKFLVSLNFGFGRPDPRKNAVRYAFKKAVALLTLGNTRYNGSDVISEEGGHFSAAHIFYDKKEFLDEVEIAGLKIEEVNAEYGCAVLSA